MIRTWPLYLLLLAACAENPAEVRSEGEQFPVIAMWTGTAAPVGSSPLTGTLTIQQRQGFRMNAGLTLTDTTSTDTLNRRYQWRIFRGDCATNFPAVNQDPSGPSPTGLLLFATVQSYPDVTVEYASGTGSAAPTIAGSLDSLTAYSVRVRLSQQATNWNGTNPIACGDLQRTPAS